MKHLLLIIAVVLVGCSKQEETQGPSQPEPAIPPLATGTPEPTPKPTAESPKVVPEKRITDPIIEKAIRKSLEKPTGELTKADLEKVTMLNLENNQLTDLPKSLEKLTQLTRLYFGDNELTEVPKGLEKLTQLTGLDLQDNQLTDVKGLEKLTQLKELHLNNNPNLTKAQIAELKKALPKYRKIFSNPTK